MLIKTSERNLFLHFQNSQTNQTMRKLFIIASLLVSVSFFSCVKTQEKVVETTTHVAQKTDNEQIDSAYRVYSMTGKICERKFDGNVIKGWLLQTKVDTNATKMTQFGKKIADGPYDYSLLIPVLEAKAKEAQLVNLPKTNKSEYEILDSLYNSYIVTKKLVKLREESKFDMGIVKNWLITTSVSKDYKKMATFGSEVTSGKVSYRLVAETLIEERKEK